MLRVIAGKYKSRKFSDVKSTKTRPTTDKNKESIFNSIGQFFDGGACLDLYAGSGSLGIEALSRGMTSCDFVDLQYKAIQTIRSNIQSLDVDESFQIIKKEALVFLNSTDQKYDLILIDPPYALKPYVDCLDVIHSRQLLNKHGIIVMESDHQTDINDLGDIIKIKEKILGQTKITIFRREIL
jgi:16S rRNA (guanine(966)-N(2))-methyltransferase RsmD